jgi:hypothetical protein
MSDNNEDIDNIIDALKEKNLQLNKEIRKVSKENIEDFVVDSAGTVINECVDLVKNLGVYLHAGPSAKDLSAYAELINASANAIETLNKLIVQDKKSSTLKELKKMDHDSKRALLGDAKEMILLTREDMLNKLKEVEVEPVELETKILDTEPAERITYTTSNSALSSSAS